MGRRYAGGPPNGTCQNCPNEARSLDSDYCSRRCQHEHQNKQAKEAYLQEKYEQGQSQ